MKKSAKDAVRESAQRLQEHVREFSSTAMVGMGAKSLYVYARTREDVRRAPKEWEGFPVVVRIVGKVKPAG